MTFVRVICRLARSQRELETEADLAWPLSDGLDELPASRRVSTSQRHELETLPRIFGAAR